MPRYICTGYSRVTFTFSTLWANTSDDKLMTSFPEIRVLTFMQNVSICMKCQKNVREKSRECHRHKPQPFLDTKRKRKPTKPNKRKSNKRTKSTKISSLLFSGKNQKNISVCRLLKFLPRVLSIKFSSDCIIIVYTCNQIVV